ncbi:MAG: type II secretion system protein M [Gammaproteobacteria bacterium]|nr:type II secretion system protein M [Gammaproteobacteria bacterium]
MSALQQYWRHLDARERIYIVVGVLSVVAILFYANIWAPWQDTLKHLRKQVPVQRQVVTNMEMMAAQIKPLLKKSLSSNNKSRKPVLTVIESTATASKLRDAIKQMRPGERDQYQVWLQDTDFDQWMRWIDSLRKAGIEVISVSVSKAQEGSMVNIRMTVSRG